jgi:transaldolase
MEDGYFHRVTAQTLTRFWINNVTHRQTELALEAGAVGCTQNPSYTWKMLTDPVEGPYAKSVLRETLNDSKDSRRVETLLQAKLVKGIAEKFMPLFNQTRGKWGYVSIQGDPTEEKRSLIIEESLENRKLSLNIMAKVPVVEEGLRAMEKLIRERVPINATEVMGVRQAIDVCELYEKLAAKITNPAPLYFSHIAGIFDEYLSKIVAEKSIDVSRDSLWQAGLAVARKIGRITCQRGYSAGFIAGGARGLHHFTEMVGGKVCVTINWEGTADKLIELDPPVVSRFFNPVSDSVIDELLEKLPDFRKAYLQNGLEPEEYESFGPVCHFRDIFVDAWSKAAEVITEAR